jgi:hypothetical protein
MEMPGEFFVLILDGELGSVEAKLKRSVKYSRRADLSAINPDTR